RHFAVGEPNVVELDASRAGGRFGMRRVNDLRRRVQQLEDALRRGHGRLQDVVLFAEVLNGAEEALGVLHEGHQHAQSDGVAQHRAATKPDDRGNGAGGKNFHHRVVDGVRHDGVFERVHVGGVDFFELFVSALLAIEKLQDHDAADMLLQICVDAGYSHANAAVTIAYGAAEEGRSYEDQRQGSEGDERQPPLHPQHDDDDAGQYENVFDDRDHAGGEQLVERVHVGGDASDQAAYRIAVEESDVHLLQMAEDLAAQVEHHLLAGPLHVIGLGEFQEETEAQQENVEAAELGDSGQRARAQPAVQKTVHAGLLREIFINRNLRE